MDTTYPIRPIDDSELPAFGKVTDHAFNASWPPEGLLELDRIVFEAERSLAAFDGDQIVGTTVAYSFTLTVPGGQVPAAGVSAVGVMPTYRRRGILSSLMKHQLADVAAGDEPVAALFASEAPIYGRFGYGRATEDYTLTLRRGEAALRPLPPDAGPAPVLRLAEPRQVIDELRPVYDANRASRPGMMSRNSNWWQQQTADPEFFRDGASPMRCVIAQDESGPRGYAFFSVKPEWGSDGIPAHRLAVRELMWTDLAACAALWSDLLTRDLVAEVSARGRPLDEPLRFLLADPRRARPSVHDGLWVRIIDLPAALTRRCYTAEADVVIEVVDDLIPANTGRWRLSAGSGDAASASCERTSASADITLPVWALGAAYLGGTKLSALARAGQLTEHAKGSTDRLSAAMGWDMPPWSPMGF